MEYTPITVEEIRSLSASRPQLERLELKGLDLSGLDLSGVDLAPVDVKFCDATGAKFDDAWLLGTNWEGTVLKGTSFRGSNLDYAFFSMNQCSEVDFTGARLHEAMFCNCEMENVDFTNAALLEAEFHHTKARGVIFDGADLRKIKQEESSVPTPFSSWRLAEEEAARDLVELLGGYGRKAESAHPRQVEASLERIKAALEEVAERTRIRSAEARDARETLHVRRLNGEREFIKERFDFMDLTDLDLTGCVFTGCSFRGTRLSNSDLSGSVLKDVFLLDAVLDGAKCKGTDFTGASATMASFRGADMREAVFRGASLQNADFRGAWLEDADFTGAEGRNIDLREAAVGPFKPDIVAPMDAPGIVGPILREPVTGRRALEAAAGHEAGREPSAAAPAP